MFNILACFQPKIMNQFWENVETVHFVPILCHFWAIFGLFPKFGPMGVLPKNLAVTFLVFWTINLIQIIRKTKEMNWLETISSQMIKILSCFKCHSLLTMRSCSKLPDSLTSDKWPSQAFPNFCIVNEILSVSFSIGIKCCSLGKFHGHYQAIILI